MKELQLNDFLDYNYLAQLNTNPSKKCAAFIRSKARLDENDYDHNLYLFDGDSYKNILNLGQDSRYYWESDTSILFHNAKLDKEKDLVKNKNTVIYRYNIKNGEIEHAYTFKFPISSLKVLDNGKILLTGSLNEDDHQLFDDEKRGDYIASLTKQANYEVFEEVPFYFNGGGFTKAKRGQAFIYDPKKESYKSIVSKDLDISMIRFDDETQIAYFVKETPIGQPQFTPDLIAYDTKNEKLDEIYSKQEVSISKLAVLDGKTFVFANDRKTTGLNQNSDIYLLESGSLTKVKDFGLSGWNSVGSDARLGGSISDRVIDDVFYFAGTYHDRSVLYSFDGENIETVFDVRGSLDGWVLLDGIHYGIGLYENRLQELYELDFDKKTIALLSDFNSKYWKECYIAKPEHIEYESNGDMLDGWVLLPKDYDASKTYPAILDIHGGPKTIYGDIFYHEMQAWANMGYVVFFTNPHGGDAYGNEFSDIRGKYGTIDYEDIMTFTDIVLDKYAIDPKKVGVTGGSYGGFMTNWIVSHTDRFAAAATQRCISNWVSFYGTSDIGVYFGVDQTASSPFDNIEQMWEQSPLKHAQNIKTPLLFIHSEEDYRCPIEQGMQLFTAIKVNGVETRFVWIRGENHDLSRSGRPQSRVKRLEEITNWMNSHLK